jgi:hypothetical protein
MPSCMSAKAKFLSWRLLGLCLAAAMALTVAPAAATAAVESHSASLESGKFEEFSQTNVEEGSLALTNARASDGSASAHATYAGGGANGYSRGIWDVQWEEGEDVWFGGAYYLPIGFHASIEGQVDLLRWDNWASHPSDTDWGGVSIYGSDRRARLLRFGAGRPNDTLVGPLQLPEGRWFRLEVHQRLSRDSGALSELYVDGALVGSSTAPNTYGRPVERIRYGIVAIASEEQEKPLELWFDQATAGPGPSGETSNALASSRGSSRLATTSTCTTRRRASRRGVVLLRRIATTCRAPKRTCRDVRVRSRGSGGRSLGRIRTCVTPRLICQTRKRIVWRHGQPPRRARKHSCRARA